MGRLSYTFMVLGVLGCAACSHELPPPQVVSTTTPPEWVTRGSGAFTDQNAKVFYGVGSVSGIRNQGLARKTADNRARNEISQIFEVYSASLMKDYQASTTAGNFDKTSEEQHVELAIKTFAANTLSGVMLVDHWTHPDGTLYALARLDLEAFANNLDAMKELNNKVRDYVRSNAARAHGELEAEEAKRAGANNPSP